MSAVDGSFAAVDEERIGSGLAELESEIARLDSLGVNAVFHFYSTQDAKNSTQVIGGASQGGLGLPDRDYFTKTDDKSKSTAKKKKKKKSADDTTKKG